MNSGNLQIMLQAQSIECEMQAMIAENKQREMDGLALAYDAGAFNYLSDRLVELAREITHD